MKTLTVILTCVLPALSQQLSPVNIFFYAESIPTPSGRLGVAGYGTSRTVEEGKTVVQAWVLDASSASYFGCDILLELRGDDAYFATFRPLSIIPADLVRNVRSSAISDTSHWTLREPAAYPLSRRILIGETLAIDLNRDSTTGQRVVGYLRLLPAIGITKVRADIKEMNNEVLETLASRLSGDLQVISREIDRIDQAILFQRLQSAALRSPRTPALRTTQTPPFVQGAPRDLTVADAEFAIILPRVSINRTSVNFVLGPEVHSASPWLYIPGRGRFTLSLVPRTGFERLGSASKGVLTINADPNEITIESQAPIVPEGGTFFIYVRNDRNWLPSESDASQIAVGTD